MVIHVIACLAGILSIQQLSALPPLIWLIPIGLLLVIFVKIKYHWLAFYLAGVIWAIIFATGRIEGRLPEALAGHDLAIKGIIADLPDYDDNHVRFNFIVTEAPDNVPNKIRLTWYYPEHPPKAGQQWAFTVRLKPPHGNFNPGGFDYERWLLVEGIGATGYIRTKPQPMLLASDVFPYQLSSWRQSIIDQFDALLVNLPTLAMIKALTIGDGSGLSPAQWDVFRTTGTTHLLVISGSHIGLIAGLAYWFTKLCWLRLKLTIFSPQKAAAFVAVLAAFFYAGLTGFSVPAQRALVMVAVAMLAIMAQRNIRPFPILALALFAVLVIDPLVVLMPGFWLSFLAVSLIIYLLDGRLRKPGFIKATLKINWAVSLGLAPALLCFFQQFSLIAPIANLIVAPLIGLIIIPLALLATLLLFVLPQLAIALFSGVDFCLQGLWWLLAQMANIPYATLTYPQPPGWALAFACPAIVLLFAPKGMPARWLGIVMLLPLLTTKSDKINPGDFKLTLLDVGQGLSAVVQTANHNLVFDTGAKFSSSSDSGQSVILPYLHSQAIDKIDALVISHGDNDHIGGVDSLLRTMAIDKTVTSVPELLPLTASTFCHGGQAWSWDNVKFTFLTASLGQFASDNNKSCVLHIQGEHGAALLPGDIEAEAEAELVNNFSQQLKADVLIAPHHGSDTSSTTAFLKAVQPKSILIPAGYRNSFGHPHQTVLARYQHLGITWLNTADAGSIEIRAGKSIIASSWRDVAGHYWNFYPASTSNLNAKN